MSSHLLYSTLLVSGLALYGASALAQEKTDLYTSKTPPNDQLVIKRASDMKKICGDIVGIVSRFTVAENKWLIIGLQKDGGWEDMQLMRSESNRWLLTCATGMGGTQRGFIAN